jgi:tryptophanyl-tRNA synthetase
MSIPKEIMSIKWLCHSGIDKMQTANSMIITTGVGLSGIPHMGTLSQILRSVFLQKHGFKVQLVLGDLDSYNARNKPIKYVSELAKKYHEFIAKLGFDETAGILRNQFDHSEINRFAYLISKCLTDQDFYETEEDLSELYINKGVYNGITFPVKQAILLMIADFIFLGQTDKYKNVIVMLGLEEHKYVLLARKIIERMGLHFKLYSIYSRIIRGLNGYPKMSKSIKGSAITVDMSAAKIRQLIIGEGDDYNVPENSVIFQMMSSVSNYTVDELAKIYQSCISKGNDWMSYKKDYANRLVDCCAKWK